jgi:hypothetical protein
VRTAPQWIHGRTATQPSAASMNCSVAWHAARQENAFMLRRLTQASRATVAKSVPSLCFQYAGIRWKQLT